MPVAFAVCQNKLSNQNMSGIGNKSCGGCAQSCHPFCLTLHIQYYSATRKTPPIPIQQMPPSPPKPPPKPSLPPRHHGNSRPAEHHLLCRSLIAANHPSLPEQIHVQMADELNQQQDRRTPWPANLIEGEQHPWPVNSIKGRTRGSG